MRITEESPEKPVNYWHTRLSLSLAGLGVLAFSFSLSLFILSFRTVSNYESEPKTLYMPRQIVYVMGNYYYRHRDVYDRVAESFVSTGYEGFLAYYTKLKGFPGTNILLDSNKCQVFLEGVDFQAAAVPYIGSIRYFNGIVSFSDISVIHYYEPISNLYGRTTRLIYSIKSEKELSAFYNNCAVYADSISNSVTDGWLYRISDNWYVLSPDDVM